jgi:hypothetical protein
VVAVEAATPATVQEVHQVLVHLLCLSFEASLADAPVTTSVPPVGSPLSVAGARR